MPLEELLDAVAEMTAAIERPTVLEEAAAITAGDRNADYGDPDENHGRTAELFGSFLRGRLLTLARRIYPDGVPNEVLYFISRVSLFGRDACMFNILQKVSREANATKRDNLVDIAGYAANAEKCE